MDPICQSENIAETSLFASLVTLEERTTAEQIPEASNWIYMDNEAEENQTMDS